MITKETFSNTENSKDNLDEVVKNQETNEEAFAHQSEVRIFISEQYDKFNLSEFNRDPKHYKKLKESIKENDYTKYNPITVDKNLIIIDGQNRFLACKELGLPIHFIVAEDMHIFDAPNINKASKNWTTLDYIHHYAQRGKQEYIQILDYIAEYDQKPSTIIAFGKMSGDGRTRNRTKNVTDGIFAFRDDIDINDFFEHMKIFEPYYSFAKKDCFVRAALKLYMHEDYDKEIMESKLRITSAIVHEQPRVDMMTKELLKLYNYRGRNKSKIEL